MFLQILAPGGGRQKETLKQVKHNNPTQKWRQQFFSALKGAGAATVIAHDKSPISYDALWRNANAYAQHLRSSGLVKGDRIAVALHSEPPLITVLLGHYLAGVIHVPINTRYGRSEIEHVIQDCEPKAIWLDTDLSCAGTLRSIAQDAGIDLWTDSQTLNSEKKEVDGAAEQVVDEDIDLLIYNVGGVAVDHIKPNAQEFEYEIPGHLADGHYFLLVLDNGQIVGTKQFVIIE